MGNKTSYLFQARFLNLGFGFVVTLTPVCGFNYTSTYIIFKKEQWLLHVVSHQKHVYEKGTNDEATNIQIH